MKIELDNNEINEAIIAHVNTMGINTKGKSVSVDFTAGRKNGNTAEVSIEAQKLEVEQTGAMAKEPEAKVTPEAEVEKKNEAAKEESVAEDDDDSLFAS